jgi:RNA polymerase sigma factor (sigma-70 family)
VFSPDDEEEEPLDPADDEAGPLELSAQAECARATRNAIAQLPDRLRTVIERRFGIDCEPENLRQIGARLRVSPERVRQLESDALSRLAQDRAVSRDLL